MTVVLAAAALAVVVAVGLWVRDRRLRRWADKTLTAAFEEWEAALVAAGFDGVPQAPACPGRAPSNPPAPGVAHPTPPADARGRPPEQANPTRSNP